MGSLAKSKNSIDMLSGSIWNKLILFALPIAATSILQQLFNSADIAVVGRFAGSTALAAVGSTAALINLIINLFVGCATGANVLISSLVARKDDKSTKEAVSTALVFSLFSGLFLIVAGYFLAHPLLHLMGSPDDVINQSVIYVRIYFVGMPFLMVYNFGSAILRSIGDTKRPLIALAFSGIVNVALNLLFVAVFHMGVAGVAIATVCSEAISSALVLVFIIRENSAIKFDLKQIVFKMKHLKRIVSIGLPAGIQGMVFSLSNVCIQSGINSLGSVAMAGNAAAGNFESFSYTINSSFSISALTFASQNYAVGDYGRTKRVYHDALFISVVSMFIFDVIVFLFRYPMLSIFTNDPEVMRFGITKFEFALLPHCLITLYEVTASILRATGKSLEPAVICIIGTCLVRLLWVFTVFPLFNSFGVLVAVYPVSWVITSIMMISAYNVSKKKIFSKDGHRSLA